ncbi:hypothetical protein OF830_23930 [Bacillus paramycoides]|uniref:hypothetical protein n=1 Tax=Bacillus paramycoides TaxID=2026194 RepID=UPI0022445B9C|nr:hypothetical protein [Bacillus paramycoides]MCW9133888.1 hypothetical protein [Bacillus paramycoides]
MKMSFGKHKDKEVAWVLLTDPGYFTWMKQKGMQTGSEYQFMLEILEKLNSKPYSHVKCFGTCDGSNTPTRLSLYKGMYNLAYWFCDECSPYSQGANSGTLSTISKYDEFIRHRQSDLLIKIFCNAKGVPKRKTENALKQYFGY